MITSVTNVYSTSSSAANMSRKELVEWVNTTLDTNFTKVEEFCTGVVHCQLMDVLFPGSIRMQRVKFNVKQEHEYALNFKCLQESFTKMNVDRVIPIAKLVKGRFQDNFEFMQWFKKFFDTNYNGQDFLPLEGRTNSFFASPTKAPSFAGSKGTRERSGNSSGNPLAGRSLPKAEGARMRTEQLSPDIATNESPDPSAVGGEGMSSHRTSSGRTQQGRLAQPQAPRTSGPSATRAGTLSSFPTVDALPGTVSSRGNANAVQRGRRQMGLNTGQQRPATVKAAEGKAPVAAHRQQPAPYQPREAAQTTSKVAASARGQIMRNRTPHAHKTSASAVEQMDAAIGDLGPAKTQAAYPTPKAMFDKIEELQLIVNNLERERDFYFMKLRNVEIICQANENLHPIISHIFEVLYAEEEGFQIPDSSSENELACINQQFAELSLQSANINMDQVRNVGTPLFDELETAQYQDRQNCDHMHGVAYEQQGLPDAQVCESRSLNCSGGEGAPSLSGSSSFYSPSPVDGEADDRTIEPHMFKMDSRSPPIQYSSHMNIENDLATSVETGQAFTAMQSQPQEYVDKLARVGKRALEGLKAVGTVGGVPGLHQMGNLRFHAEAERAKERNVAIEDSDFHLA